jgi:hypothetical protein
MKLYALCTLHEVSPLFSQVESLPISSYRLDGEHVLVSVTSVLPLLLSMRAMRKRVTILIRNRLAPLPILKTRCLRSVIKRLYHRTAIAQAQRSDIRTGVVRIEEKKTRVSRCRLGTLAEERLLKQEDNLLFGPLLL